ncbi:hypothetical protein [Paenibacillus amylolyticus]|uniref:hypothetical protein n=1 Tax=Paenibacillus amylolyticus TaxID=1451 RepID=UPI00195FF1C3|nr:hypothetical protein [Paenibacillus amylolyticus]
MRRSRAGKDSERQESACSLIRDQLRIPFVGIALVHLYSKQKNYKQRLGHLKQTK